MIDDLDLVTSGGGEGRHTSGFRKRRAGRWWPGHDLNALLMP